MKINHPNQVSTPKKSSKILSAMTQPSHNTWVIDFGAFENMTDALNLTSNHSTSSKDKEIAVDGS